MIKGKSDDYADILVMMTIIVLIMAICVTLSVFSIKSTARIKWKSLK